MTDTAIYQDIAKRTGGEIYLGVVGPVRSGKSTFIHRFLECAVLPYMNDEYEKARVQDEMPQSANGKTVMTTEPKFVPDVAAAVRLSDGCEAKVRLCDCVGYLVDGAMGAEEAGVLRMVKTPWADAPLPFAEAAVIGTDKVIAEHATVAVLVTTDGSFTDIPRKSYEEAEEKVAEKLKALGKPFIVLLNSAHPESEAARKLAISLEDKYGVSVALVHAGQLEEEDALGILSLLLGEFPVRELTFSLPTWTEELPKGHPLLQNAVRAVEDFAGKVEKLGDVSRELELTADIACSSLSAADGEGVFTIPLSQSDFLSALSDVSGLAIEGERDLLHHLRELSFVKAEYDKVKDALADVRERGYGVVMPKPEELTLEEPRTVKTASGYGVKVAAHAESIHMIKANIRAEVAPVVGSAAQSEEVMRYLSGEYESNPDGIWQTNMLGKSLCDLMNESLYEKLAHIPDDSREKLAETLEKILNDGANGLICILL